MPKQKDLTLPIEYHHTFDVHDSTKLKTYMDCPRKYFYEYILGWRPEGGNIHLIFGSAIHEAFEILLQEGYGLDIVNKAFAAFEKSYFAEVDKSKDDHPTKNASKAFNALWEYVQTYATVDNFSDVRTEIAGTVPINNEDEMSFRIDAIIKDADGIYVMDHKTASRLSEQWTNQWTLSMQLGLYIHVLYCLYDKEDVWGAKINGIVLTKKSVDLCRVPVKKSPAQMLQWLYNVNEWMTRLKQDWLRLEASTPSHAVMQAFGMNTESCTKYFGCPYLPYCTSWPNPLQYADNPPIGFKVERWDPKQHNEEGAKEVHNNLKLPT